MEKKQGQTRKYLKSRRLLIIIMGLTKEISKFGVSDTSRAVIWRL